MTRGSAAILMGQPRVRLRYATAPASPSHQNGSCFPTDNHLETKSNHAIQSVTDVLGRKCYRCARTVSFNRIPRVLPLYIRFPMSAFLGKRGVSTGEPARSCNLRTGRSQWERLALERSFKTSSQPSLFPGFARLELEQLPEPEGGREASSELVSIRQSQSEHSNPL
jgi:hypothetical protein